MIRTTTALFALLATPALSQGSGSAAMGEDCAFLAAAFEETYRGLREEEGRVEGADMEQVMMYLQIQENTLELAQAAECDVGPMVDAAREHLRRYEDS